MFLQQTVLKSIAKIFYFKLRLIISILFMTDVGIIAFYLQKPFKTMLL